MVIARLLSLSLDFSSSLVHHEGSSSEMIDIEASSSSEMTEMPEVSAIWDSASSKGNSLSEILMIFVPVTISLLIEQFGEQSGKQLGLDSDAI